MTDALAVSGLLAGYGQSRVLQGVDFELAAGSILAVLGRNGSGRSTLARALMGLVPARGSVRWLGHELLGLPPHAIARLGVAYVPESRDVFPRLTVAQNLTLGLQPRSTRPVCWTQEWVYDSFPALAARWDVAAGVLSGGEQQMLSLCRALMGAPQLLIVDEPTEGLAPQVVTQVDALLRALSTQGMAVLLIEQKLDLSLAVADRVAVMGHGRLVFDGSPAQLLASPAVVQEWLEV
ncbi:ABC transporter ATP-binding protein [Hydrogenophaga atypica]|uniref:ABC transporter ATP-binding protein n=1 Tax=Hydrogenophaga atypica TaxID=249409 RepID=A0ABW2QNU3_9BURK